MTGLEQIKRIYNIYGGWKALFVSKFFIVSLILTLLSIPLWISGGWWETVIQILPNLIGFTLGGYAIILAFSDTKFLSKLSGSSSDSKHSPFLDLCATFAHFIFIQCLALILAILAKAWNNNLLSELAYWKPCWKDVIPIVNIASKIFWAFGFLTFTYSITLIYAAVLRIFQLGVWLDIFHELNKQKELKEAQDKKQSN